MNPDQGCRVVMAQPCDPRRSAAGEIGPGLEPMRVLTDASGTEEELVEIRPRGALRLGGVSSADQVTAHPP
jgi:hypothetical protein